MVELEYLSQLQQDDEVDPKQTPTLDKLGLPADVQKRLRPYVTPDKWLDLSLIELHVIPEFEYRTKEGAYISFSAASAGQQASALLGALLLQEGSPLLIDQPEDDLDSNTISQIAPKIWAAKGQRQLIFTSHNANMVVNGDADLVLVCDYLTADDQSNGHIKEQGSIDVAPVRRSITSVMEGGERAFRLRKEKYQF